MKKFLALALVLSICLAQIGCSSNLIDTVLADLPIATDIAISVVNIVSPGNASYTAEVTEYAGKVGADLKLLESLIAQYKNDLAAAPGGVIGQINAALSDAQSNLAAILQAVGVSDPKVTAAVAAAVASVKLILNDAALLIQQSAPPAVSARLFFGMGLPGVDFMGIGKTQPGAAVPHNPRGSGKSVRQIAREYNQKISKDFPKAKVNVPRLHVLGIPVPLSGGK